MWVSWQIFENRCNITVTVHKAKRLLAPSIIIFVYFVRSSQSVQWQWNILFVTHLKENLCQQDNDNFALTNIYLPSTFIIVLTLWKIPALHLSSTTLSTHDNGSFCVSAQSWYLFLPNAPYCVAYTQAIMPPGCPLSPWAPSTTPLISLDYSSPVLPYKSSEYPSNVAVDPRGPHTSALIPRPSQSTKRLTLLPSLPLVLFQSIPNCPLHLADLSRPIWSCSNCCHKQNSKPNHYL